MSAKSIPVIGFAAFSGTGKTTVVTKVIPVLRRHGLKLAVIKHAHHDFVIDTPGKDSYELKSAGAEQVLIASSRTVAWVMDRADSGEPQLSEMLAHLCGRDLDLIIVEGYKKASFTKIEVYRSGVRYAPLANQDSNVIAVATDCPGQIKTDVPRLQLDDYEAIAEFILHAMTRHELTLTTAAR